jgi:hypothetical protein
MRAILLRKAREAELLDKDPLKRFSWNWQSSGQLKVGGKWRLTEISKNRERSW